MDGEKIDKGDGPAVPPGEPHPPGHQQHEAPPAWHSPGPSPVPSAEGSTAVANEEKTWGLMVHISALAGLLVPLGQIWGPLILWIVKKDQSAFVDHQGKEALNFQITMMALVFLGGALLFFGMLLAFILVGIPILILGGLAMGVFYVISLVFAIVGAVKANEGVWYRYPMTWRFIR